MWKAKEIMVEPDQSERFRFVPFAEQPDYPTWEEKLAHPRVHTILLPVDYSAIEFEDLGQLQCEFCHYPYVRAVKDFTQTWGDIEQLRCVIPQTPQLECGCVLFRYLEDPVYQRMPAVWNTMRTIYRAINAFTLETEDAEFNTLRGILGEDDYKKVEEMAFNRLEPKESLEIRFKKEKLRAERKRSNK